jgi:hypothetical protein
MKSLLAAPRHESAATPEPDAPPDRAPNIGQVVWFCAEARRSNRPLGCTVVPGIVVAVLKPGEPDSPLRLHVLYADRPPSLVLAVPFSSEMREGFWTWPRATPPHGLD